ncbi:MAG: choice-of-anchor D domain-containing protein, partial [Candidatus Hatepunaea meridiana]|nr:choice-of-anchor D domain-containing protein [Candidatus Hatepunaea meridiana]
MRLIAIPFITVLFLLMLYCFPAEANIRNVPDNYESIQAGIDAAWVGDTVLVQPGTYVENLDFIGKNITVGSLYLITGDESFISNTIIDGDNAGRCVIFRSGEGSEAVLSGFTLENGTAPWGGGIYCNAANGACTPTLDHLVIHRNHASRYGGGMYSTQGANPTLINVTIYDNTAVDGYGTFGTFGGGSTAQVTNCIFWGNDPFDVAGGLTITYSDIENGFGGEGNIDQDPLFVDADNGDFHLTENSPCVDTGDPNSPENPDGSRVDMGAYFYNQGNVHVFNVPDEYNTIQEAIGAAGDSDTVLVHPGTYIENINFNGKEIVVASLLIITDDEDYIHETIIDGDDNGSVATFNNDETANSVLMGFTLLNGQADQGGGIICSSANPTLKALEIESNSAQYGGGIYLEGSNAILTNISIIQNNSSQVGGGINCNNSNPSIINCTISRNSSDNAAGGIYCDEDSDPAITSCIVWENDPSQITGDGDPQVTYSNIEDGFNGQGNIDADPLFADPDGGDFQLTWANWRDDDETKSPCINTGDPLREFDPDNTRADMGAWYWHQDPYHAIITVNPQTLDTQVNTGETDQLSFNIANDGDTLLIFQTDVDITIEPELLPRRDRRGGPDDIEYEWRDNDEDDGPDYNWIDVSGFGDVVEVNMGNDTWRGPFDLGFDFDFYGETYNSIKMCSNGWASFTRSGINHSYADWDELPTDDDDAPEDFLAVAMSDWNPAQGGDYYFWTDDETAVLTWENVPHITGMGSWTFQIVLTGDGMIKYQYAETGSPDGIQLVGCQNHDKSHGFEIIRNEEDYLVDERVIAISRVWPEWIRVAPTGGEIEVDDNLDMDVFIDAEDLIEGDYEADIHLLSNDFENPDAVVAVTLEVVGLASIDVRWDGDIGYPDSVDWNSAYDPLLAGYNYDLTLDVHNVGASVLQVDSVTVDNDVFSIPNGQFNVSPGDDDEMIVILRSEEPGRYETNMTIYSNDPEQQTYQIFLTGTITVLAPEIEVVWAEEAGYPDLVDWNQLYDDLYATAPYDIPIIIRNTGNRALEIADISSGNDYFSADANDFVLEPDEERDVVLTFEADISGEFMSLITIENNTETDPNYLLSVHALALDPPVINLNPESITDSLYVGWLGEHTINVSNDGEATLNFTIDHEINSEEERDVSGRRLRSVDAPLLSRGGGASPRRDDAGDLLYQVESPFGANQYRNLGYDPDDNWMWHQQYSNPKRMIAWDLESFDPEGDDPPEIVADWNNPTANPMDFAYYNGVIYLMNLWDAWVGRVDLEGNIIGNLYLDLDEGSANGVAIDAEEELLFVGNNNSFDLYVFDLEGNRIANIGNLQAMVNNQQWRSIEWVPKHNEGQLWVNAQSRVWQIAVDTDSWEYIGDEAVQSFETHSTIVWDGLAHDGRDLWVASREDANVNIYDDGATEAWLYYEPDEGELTGGEDMNILLTLDARGLIEGYYDADMIFHSNDPVNSDLELNIRLFVTEPPSMVVEWDVDYGFPDEVNWNDAYSDLYNNQTYDIELRLVNYSDGDITVDGIDFEGAGAEFYRVDRDQFSIDQDGQTTITVTLETDESGDHPSTMVIHSDAEDVEDYSIDLTGHTLSPPDIVINPEDLSDNLITGEVANHNLNIANEGESQLRFTINAVSVSEPDRDANDGNSRSLRSINSPRRDDPGDVLFQFDLDYDWSGGFDWDNDNKIMWVGSYGNDRIHAYNYDGDGGIEKVFDQALNDNCMAMGYMNDIIYTNLWAESTIYRYNTDGNNIGNVNTAINQIQDYAHSDDNDWLFVLDGQFNIHILDVENDHEEVGVINDLRGLIGDAAYRSICWVDYHDEGQLWVGGQTYAWQFYVDVDDNYNAQLVQTIQDDSDNQWNAIGHDGENIWRAMQINGTAVNVYDDGIAEIRWLSVDTKSGEIDGESELDITVILDAYRLIGGQYVGELHIMSNDPDDSEVVFEVTMTVNDAPDIEVTWDNDYGYPDNIDWNQAEEIYTNQSYNFTFRITSTGVTDLQVEGIVINDDAFSANADQFELVPDEYRDVIITFEPDQDGDYDVTLTITSTSEVHPEVVIPMHATVQDAPEIRVIPTDIETTLMIGATEQRNITVENNGDALLRFDTNIEITSEPDRDGIGRRLRGISGAPHRDDIGDVIATLSWGSVGANNYKGGIAYDWDNEWMWLTTYTNNRIGAVSFDDNYENINEEISWSSQRPMGAAWMDGVLYNINLTGNTIDRWDAEGNNLNPLNVGGINSPTALASSPEENLLFVMESAGDFNIHVLEVNGDNVNEIGTIDWRQGALEGQGSRSINWVNKHPDGQLWINTPGHVWQLAIDQNWEVTGVVEDFDWAGNQQWDGIGHDGHNLWLGGYNQDEYLIVDDNVTELYWLMLEPTEGEVPSGDNNSMDLTLTFNAVDLIEGRYEAEIHFLSNDPFNPDIFVTLVMNVEETPDIEVTWEHYDADEPDLVDWNDYFPELFTDDEYRAPVTIRNTGGAILQINDITADEDEFSAEPTQFDLDPDEERVVEFIFTGPQADVYEASMTISSNDPDEDEVVLQLHALTISPPDITVDPVEITTTVERNIQEDHSINIANSGQTDLRWWSSIEVMSVPEAAPRRDVRGQSGRLNTPVRHPQSSRLDTPVRQSQSSRLDTPVRHPQSSRLDTPVRQSTSQTRVSDLPRRGGRDDAGDEITRFTWQRSGITNHKAGIAWDEDNEWMWLTDFNIDYIGAIDPVDNYDEVIAWQPGGQHPMGAAWLDGTIYIVNWAQDYLGRWDSDGNNLGNFDTPSRPVAVSSSGEYILVMTDADDRDISVLTTDGEQIGLIEDYQQYIEGQSASLQWVNLHPDGELWINTPGHIYQINVNANWEATELVQDIEWDGNQAWDGIGHDGDNLWIGGWNQADYIIMDDGVEELHWLTIAPARGILELDNNQDAALTLDTQDLITGTYEAELHILSNDPDNSDVVVSVTLLVPEPDIAVEPDPLEFGGVNVDASSELQMTIHNNGNGILTVSDISVEGDYFTVEFNEQFTIEPDSQTDVSVQFVPEEEGDFAGVVTVTSDDPDDGTVTINLTGTGVYEGHAPVVDSPIPNVDINEDFNSFTVADLDTVFSDPDEDDLTYGAQSDDENLTVEIINESQLLIDSAPDWHGDAVVTVTADDGHENVQDDFIVTVNPLNDSPEVISAIPDLTVNEDTDPWIVADLDTVFDDVDGDDLEFTVLTDDLTADIDDNNVLTLDASENYNGDDIPVVVRANDGQETIEDNFLVTINAANDPPEVTNPIAEQTFFEDTGPWNIVDLDDVFNDVDGDALTFSAVAEDPLEAQINGRNVLTITAPENFNSANLTVTVTARDEDDSVDDVFLMTITPVNDPPEWVEIPQDDIEADEDDEVWFEVIGSDVDGDDITIAYTSADLPGTVDYEFDDNDTGTFTWQTTYNDADSYTATFTLSDGNDNIVTDVTIVINDVNRAPVLTEIGNLDIEEEEEFTLQLEAADPDGDDLTFEAENLPEGATLDGNQFSWTPDADQAGNYEGIIFRVRDNGNPSLSNEETITITVGDVNHLPVLTAIGNLATDEMTELTFLLEAADQDGDNLSFETENLPEGATLEGDLFSWTPNYDQAGVYNGIIFRVRDDGDPSLSSEETIAITVNNVNRAPVLTAIGNLATDEMTELTFLLEAADQDGDNLSYEAENLPEGATLEGSLFSWTPDYDQAGVYNGIIFRVLDDGDPNLSSEETIAITVNNVNRAPVLTAIGNL